MFSLDKKYNYILPSGKKIPLHKKPKTSSNKEDNHKTNKVTQYIKTEVQQSQSQNNNKDNTDDNDKPSTN